jgi:Mrp family chromosome partitioning ATPase
LHQQFGLKNEIGLSELLCGTASMEAVLHRTNVRGLCLITRGTPVHNPGELYLNRHADAWLQGIYNKFDFIVIDSTPVLAADDTTSLAPKVDATFFVLRFGYSSSRASRRALEMLKGRQANVL